MPPGCCAEWIRRPELVSFLSRAHASSAFIHTSVNKLNIQLLVFGSRPPRHLDVILEKTNYTVGVFFCALWQFLVFSTTAEIKWITSCDAVFFCLCPHSLKGL